MTARDSFTLRPSEPDDPMSISSILNGQTPSWHRRRNPRSGRAQSVTTTEPASPIRGEGTRTKITNSQDQEQMPFSNLHVHSSTTIKHETTKPKTTPLRKYTEEEGYFIWYSHVIFGQGWSDVLISFNRQFKSRPRQTCVGLVCKMYRFVKINQLPTRRKMNRTHNGKPEQDFFHADNKDFVNIRANLQYTWMLEALRAADSQFNNS
jgi:hypothetical protein